MFKILHEIASNVHSSGMSNIHKVTKICCYRWNLAPPCQPSHSGAAVTLSVTFPQLPSLPPPVVLLTITGSSGR